MYQTKEATTVDRDIQLVESISDVSKVTECHAKTEQKEFVQYGQARTFISCLMLYKITDKSDPIVEHIMEY